MEIVSVNAEAKLTNLASSIGRSPQSWRGGFCLRISLDGLDENVQSESFFWTKSLVESYLKGMQSHIYFCENSAIHIISNSVPFSVLENAGLQICELILAESGASISYKIYDLLEDGEAYAQEVLGQKNGLFGLVKNSGFEPDDFQKQFILDEAEQVFASPRIISDVNAKVLLVEDDPVTRWLVRQTLKDNCDFATAQTANKAFSLYATYQPDFVFLDINLPDKDGYEVLNWIMRNDPGANVIMFSSLNNMDSITRALDMGAIGYIAKPFIKNQILDYVQGEA